MKNITLLILLLPAFCFSQIIFDWTNIDYYTHTNGSTAISQTIDGFTAYVYHTNSDGDLRIENEYIISDVTTSSNIVFIEFSYPADVKSIRLLSKDGSNVRVASDYLREDGTSIARINVSGFTDNTINVNLSPIKRIELDFESDNWAIGEVEVNSYFLDNKEVSLSNIKIYPNPTSDFIKIKANYNIINSSYVVFDVLGQVVLKGQINGIDSVIDVNNLIKGIYFLKIGNNNSYKFIKD